MNKAICIIPKLREACTNHRHDERPYAYCCNGDPKHCDCARPDHSTALFPRPRAQPPLPEASGDVELREAGQFLLDRLSELEFADDGYDNLVRDWFGHVEPAIYRFRELLSRPDTGGKEAGGEGK